MVMVLCVGEIGLMGRNFFGERGGLKTSGLWSWVPLPHPHALNPIPGGYFMYVGRGGGAKLP